MAAAEDGCCGLHKKQELNYDRWWKGEDIKGAFATRTNLAHAINLLVAIFVDHENGVNK